MISASDLRYGTTLGFAPAPPSPPVCLRGWSKDRGSRGVFVVARSVHLASVHGAGYHVRLQQDEGAPLLIHVTTLRVGRVCESCVREFP